VGRYLNVGIIQMPVTTNTAENFKFLEEKVDNLMKSYHKPELVCGVESIASFTSDVIPGRVTDYFASIAKRHGIYFIPGTISEESEELPDGMCYNTAIVFNPEGELIAKYRKMAPWRPAEQFSAPGHEYCVFEIPEKKTKIGLQICYDLNFPEISRNETLMGAEVLIKLTMDPQELYELNKHVHYARALENQAYFVSTNCVGKSGAFQMYGHSQVISPEGDLIWEGSQSEAIATVTLDLDLVKRCRRYGTRFMDHYLQDLRYFKFDNIYGNDISKAEVFKGMPEVPLNCEDYDRNMAEAGVGQIGKRKIIEHDVERYRKNVEEFLKERK